MKERFTVVVLTDGNFNWSKGKKLQQALENFEKIHGYKYNFFNEEGITNAAYAVRQVEDYDAVFVDDIGQLHYPKGSAVDKL